MEGLLIEPVKYEPLISIIHLTHRRNGGTCPTLPGGGKWILVALQSRTWQAKMDTPSPLKVVGEYIDVSLGSRAHDLGVPERCAKVRSASRHHSGRLPAEP